MRQPGLCAVTVLWATTALAQSGGSFDLSWSTIEPGGARGGGSFGMIDVVGQPDVDTLAGGTVVLTGGFLAGAEAAATSECQVAGDCADLDGNGVRDDNCVWNDCAVDACTAEDTVFADMGGAFGTCPPDGFANVHDRNLALTCFSGATACAGINIDAGGAFGACGADGFCNIHDANHALAAFSGTTTCSCPSNPMPEWPPAIAGDATLQIVPRRRTVRSGELIEVDVLIASSNALRGYQLDLVVSGGRTGELRLVDIEIAVRKDWVFARDRGVFEAFNLDTGQMLCGLNDGPADQQTGSGYLATYRYRVSSEARGDFVIDVATGPSAQTYLVAPQDRMIAVSRTAPARITIE